MQQLVLRSRPVLIGAGFAATLAFACLAVRDVDLGVVWGAFQGSRQWWPAPALATLALAVLLRCVRRVLGPFAIRHSPASRELGLFGGDRAGS